VGTLGNCTAAGFVLAFEIFFVPKKEIKFFQKIIFPADKIFVF